MHFPLPSLKLGMPLLHFCSVSENAITFTFQKYITSFQLLFIEKISPYKYLMWCIKTYQLVSVPKMTISKLSMTYFLILWHQLYHSKFVYADSKRCPNYCVPVSVTFHFIAKCSRNSWPSHMRKNSKTTARNLMQQLLHEVLIQIKAGLGFVLVKEVLWRYMIFLSR